MRLYLSEIAVAVNGTAHGPLVEVSGAGIDSRSIEKGQLFIAVVAERDGHDFILAALERGAVAYLTQQPPHTGSAVLVDDTSAALLRLGQYARGKLLAPAIAITGSVGKTSVKDLTSAALSESMLVHANPRSFNNELGLPITLLNAPEDAGALILEMGARGHGQVARLCKAAQPLIGVVTSVAMAHTEFFGSVDEVARAKGELIEALPSDGTAVLNADDHRVAAMAGLTEARALTYGTRRGDIRIEQVRLDEHLCAQFQLATPWGRADVKLQVAGIHNAMNAAAATAAGLAFGAPLDSLVNGLQTARLSPSRMAVSRLQSGAVVIDDAYNANPTSMRAAIESLSELPNSNKIAVLGLMAELGPDQQAAHESIAELAASKGIRLIAVATDLYGVAQVNDWQAAAAQITPLGKNDAVLVKGSLVAGLQALAQHLTS